MLENWMNLELFFHLLCEKRSIKNVFYMQASITKICRTEAETQDIMTEAKYHQMRKAVPQSQRLVITDKPTS